MRKKRIENIIGLILAICILSCACYADDAVPPADTENPSTEQNDSSENDDGRADIEGIGDTSNPLDDIGNSSGSGNSSNDQPQLTPVKKKANVALTVASNVQMTVGSSRSIASFVSVSGDTIKSTSSSKKKIVSIKKGKLKAKKAGKAKITVLTKTGKKKTFTVVVKKLRIKSKGVRLNVAKRYYLSGWIRNLCSGDSIISWSSSNKRVVSVDRYGVLEARKKGKATIKAKTKYGSKAFINVIVK